MASGYGFLPPPISWGQPGFGFGLIPNTDTTNPLSVMLPPTALPVPTKPRDIAAAQGRKSPAGTYTPKEAMEAYQRISDMMGRRDVVPVRGRGVDRAGAAAANLMWGYGSTAGHMKNMEAAKENERLYTEGVNAYLADPSKSASLAESGHSELQRLAVADAQQRAMKQYEQDMALKLQERQLAGFQKALGGLGEGAP